MDTDLKKKFGIDGGNLILLSRKIHFLHVAMILIALYFIWHVAVKTMESDSIGKNGKNIIGVIDDTRKVGGKGIRRCTYYFIVGKIKYEGSIDDDYLSVGDSIKIRYLPTDPSKNRAIKWFQRH